MQAEEEWISEICRETENLQNIDIAGMHGNIKGTVGQKTCYLTQCIESKNRTIIIVR